MRWMTIVHQSNSYGQITIVTALMLKLCKHGYRIISVVSPVFSCRCTVSPILSFKMRPRGKNRLSIPRPPDTDLRQALVCCSSGMASGMNCVIPFENVTECTPGPSLMVSSVASPLSTAACSSLMFSAVAISGMMIPTAIFLEIMMQSGGRVESGVCTPRALVSVRLR